MNVMSHSARHKEELLNDTQSGMADFQKTVNVLFITGKCKTIADYCVFLIFEEANSGVSWKALTIGHLAHQITLCPINTTPHQSRNQ